MENYVNRIERFGPFSLEFILVTPHALNILKLASRIERANTSPIMERDIAKIRKILDIETIEKSFMILPKSMQLIFKNSLRDIGFYNYATEFGKVRQSESSRFKVGKTFKINGSDVSSSEKTVV